MHHRRYLALSWGKTCLRRPWSPITGHIDVVQARNGFIHLLDYKPKAREIDPVNQLLVYALAFGSRTRLPVKVFKCAWFEQKDYFEFFPLQAIKAKIAHATD